MKFLTTSCVAAMLCLGGCTTLGTASDSAAPVVSDAKAEIGAYMIVRGKGYDRAALAPYSASLPPIYEKYEGYYVALGVDFPTLEGTDDSDAILISAWPSVEAAQTFWTSPEYQESIKLREGNGEFTVVIVPAVPTGN